MNDVRLEGKKILVTGASRPLGIGCAIARALCEAGAEVALHSYAAYDAELGYPDAADSFPHALARELREKGHRAVALAPSDLSRPGAPEEAVREAAAELGPLNGLVCNHAYSVCAPLGEWTAEHIDMHLLVNVRASMLMMQAFAAQIPSGGGSVTLFTSGQYLGPMIKEIAYAVSKEAIRGLCAQAAMALAPRLITVNCVNPGPTDTGYLSGEAYQTVAEMFPAGRWGMPEDAARLVQFLQSDMARWITGQTIASEGGFRRDANV